MEERASSSRKRKKKIRNRYPVYFAIHGLVSPALRTAVRQPYWKRISCPVRELDATPLPPHPAGDQRYTRANISADVTSDVVSRSETGYMRAEGI